MSVVRQESAIEYFKELVDDAIARQGLAAKELTVTSRASAARAGNTRLSCFIFVLLSVVS